VPGWRHGFTPPTTWWWLVVHAPHSGTPFALAHSIGTAMVVLGACLLVARVAPWLLWPLAAAGSMTFTLYSLHVVAFGWDIGRNEPAALLAVHVVLALVLACVWRATVGHGPLEALAAALDRKARAAAGRPATPSG
jgi:hypothetical protein